MICWSISEPCATGPSGAPFLPSSERASEARYHVCPKAPNGLIGTSRNTFSLTRWGTFTLVSGAGGWGVGAGTPLGAMSEMLAAGMNPNMGGGDHVPNHVEAQVLDWCKEMLGYPQSASALLRSGGSMATLVGLTVARNSRAGVDVRRAGVRGAAGPLTMYGSSEMHSSGQTGGELLGLGSEALRIVPVTPAYEIDVAALETMIREDRAAGCRPICVIANAGTVNTGALDDLEALAALCARERIWLHVDGAFGAFAALVPEYRARLAPIAAADSLAFDLHKWMYKIGR